jgi:flagellar operon protein
MKDISANLNSLRPVSGGLDPARTPASRGLPQDDKFREQLKALQNSGPAAEPVAPGFSPGSALKFSNHAIDRMQARGVHFSPEQMTKIESAVAKAAAKGARNTLLLTDESALIVSVKDATVVTVMDKSALKDNVFTNIDSTVMV